MYIFNLYLNIFKLTVFGTNPFLLIFHTRDLFPSNVICIKVIYLKKKEEAKHALNSGTSGCSLESATNSSINTKARNKIEKKK